MSDKKDIFEFPGADERFIYTNEDNRYFNKPLFKPQDPEYNELILNSIFKKGGKMFFIDPGFPEDGLNDEDFRQKLMKMRGYLHKKHEEELKRLYEKMIEKYNEDAQILHEKTYGEIDKAIERLDAKIRQDS